MAAGLGFKTFTTGEVLTAADTNGYLMQGVLVFASSAARAAAITSPQEGQYSYLKDTNSTEYYDGAAWIAAPIGDITGVTAGVGITGGGTSGTVTVTNDMATTITAAGDIVVGTGSGTYDNLPIGTTAQVLTADTTVSPYKVKWATPATAGTPDFVLINSGGTALTGAATITVSSISGKNQIYIKIINASSASASSYFQLRLNTDSGLNYEYAVTQSDNEISYSNDKFLLGRMGTAAGDTFGGFFLMNGTNATGRKPFQGIGIGTGTAPRNYNISGSYFGTSAISSVSIISETGNFDAGTIFIYGA
jgi:hypothetical protein